MATVRRASREAKRGQALLKAIERIVEPPASIRARVEAALEQARRSLPDDATPEQVRAGVESELIAGFSTRTAIAGGIAALPGLVPGVGSLAALAGGGLADMTLCLKLEVEMVLALAAARGYDIEDPRERRLAYLLAAAHTYEASGGTLTDLIKAELDAIGRYAPRQMSKLLASVFVRLALKLAGRQMTRAIPFVGVVVSSVANKTLTRKVGQSALRSFDARARRAAMKQTPAKSTRPARRAVRSSRRVSAT